MEQTSEQQIYNWIKIGFLQPSERLSELFYYDKSDNQFFSILVSDYFHFDENYNVPQNVASSYPEHILKLLAGRMKRIENDDKSIIALSRTNREENTNDDYLDQKIETFLDLNSIDIKTVTIWDVDSIGSLTIDLRTTTEIEPEINQKIEKKDWWRFWN
ncbi:hypothetical protein Q1W71_04150 [Flavobacterium pectinovorum]|uniref:hypothetical protein n=1 Tax=Flavobacterium pectinovorum TaxID=29533 RepID=UPI00265E38AA|nr:hypothetical protein [Flavobacterium pectinovorum]WKL48979.1 hypothetical protein Q1W71_04150 [Flavobacterium pectinovorum]